MTPEQKIIAIAEWEGLDTKHCLGFTETHRSYRLRLKGEWKFFKSEEDANEWNEDFPFDHWEKKPFTNINLLPPYLTSRDAICGAVARLDEKQKRVFANTLYNLYLGCDHDHEGYHPRDIRISSLDLTAMILSTPTQLADALLLTLGYEI